MPKHKIAVVLLANTTTPGDMDRMANAFTTAREFAEAGDEVQFIFDGAGVKWVGALADPRAQYHRLLAAVRDTSTASATTVNA
jgi:predicted peroxiredoxin